MAYTLTVGGVAYNPRSAGVEVDDQVEARSTALFTLIVPIATSFVKGQKVELRDGGGALVFGGRVENPSRTRFGRPGTQVLYSLQCIDDHYVTDKIIVARSWVGQTCGFMVNDILTTYLAAEGISAGNIEAGPVVTEVVQNYIYAGQALDQLASYANFTWYIFNSLLYFQSYASNPAPWTLTAADVLASPAPKRDEASPMYRNRQYVKGFKDTTAALTENFHGDGVRRSFALGFPVAKVPSVVTVNAVAKTIGIKQIDTGKDWYWAKGDPVITQDTAGTLLLTTDTLLVTYQGMYEGITVSEDTSAVAALRAVEGAGTGYVDAVLDLPNASSHGAALDTAGKLLSMYARWCNKLTFTTLRSGLFAGQLLTTNLADLAYAGDQLLVTQVIIRDTTTMASPGVPQLEYQVEAVEGPFNGSWAKFFERFQNSGVPVAGSGLQTMLTLLASFTESWVAGWVETVTETIYACFAADGLTVADGTHLAC